MVKKKQRIHSGQLLVLLPLLQQPTAPISCEYMVTAQLLMEEITLDMEMPLQSPAPDPGQMLPAPRPIKAQTIMPVWLMPINPDTRLLYLGTISQLQPHTSLIFIETNMLKVRFQHECIPI